VSAIFIHTVIFRAGIVVAAIMRQIMTADGGVAEIIRAKIIVIAVDA
jgi:hypothetical protein